MNEIVSSTEYFLGEFGNSRCGDVHDVINVQLSDPAFNQGKIGKILLSFRAPFLPVTVPASAVFPFGLIPEWRGPDFLQHREAS